MATQHRTITLKRVTINKYKCIQNPQVIDIDPAITALVGMNESGKTSVLEAIDKVNSGSKSLFNKSQDYPKSELIDFNNSEEDCEIINCEYEISKTLLNEIAQELGEGVFTITSFSIGRYYKDNLLYFNDITTKLEEYLTLKVQDYTLSDFTKNAIIKTISLQEISNIPAIEGDTDLSRLKTHVKQIINDGWSWEDALSSYVAKKWIYPRVPKCLYYDEYYLFKGTISVNELENKSNNEKTKIAKAFFELAGIKQEDISNDENEDEYEKYVAVLETSSNKITKEFFEYWSTNKSLDIKIQDKKIDGDFDIRINNQKHHTSLPFDRRSKGFKYFFSFFVWFNKIQADKDSDYILLLDEPGLCLHASAQADLLRFMEECLSKKYQIIYTTHSPFMIDANHLDRIRTCLATDEGTKISDAIQERDPNTLFPLQAALGYHIAQTLFVSPNNLLVEGIADLTYLPILSNVLKLNNRTCLKDNITIVPVGGLNKVSTFISLLRGQRLNIVCLLDTFTNSKSKEKVDNLIRDKIIKDKNIRFFDEFANNGEKVADIEDLFEKSDYLKLFNAAFENEYLEIKETELDDTSMRTIVKQINKKIGKDRFDHYRPASKLTQLGVGIAFFSPKTLDNFENMFKEINKLF
ncbi:DNA replication and repair protein RecF [termite gut metagenome]|uniref:DNA replication and repair protein RecF n=1 Tax=termite gut metagenome TaxID=433724 RepID=A0A5J4QZ38_9ZZZZ